MILSTPMGPGFFIFFNEIFYDGERGGMQKHFEVLPRRIYLKKKADEPLLRWKDIIEPEEKIEIISEGKQYLIIPSEQPTIKQAIELLPKHDFDKKIQEIQKELRVVKGEAVKILKKIAEEELQEAEKIMVKILQDDELLGLIIILSEV